MSDSSELTGERYELFIARLNRRLRIRLSGLLGAAEEGGYPYAGHLEHLPELVALIMRLAVDDRVPATQRRLLVAAVVYVMSPADLLPEAVIGPVGMADDAVVAALAVEGVLSSGAAGVARALWRGDGDLAAAVRGILADGEAMVGPTVWGKIHSWVDAT